MEEIEKLILEKNPLIAKYYRLRIDKVQEVYSYGEELLPELKSSIIDGGLFNRKSIQHPLVIGDLGMMPNSDYNKQFIRKQERLKGFENDKNFESYLYLIEKPFRVTSFSELVKQNKIKRLSKNIGKYYHSYGRIVRIFFKIKNCGTIYLKTKLTPTSL